jgi:hypothetical protein
MTSSTPGISNDPEGGSFQGDKKADQRRYQKHQQRRKRVNPRFPECARQIDGEIAHQTAAAIGASLIHFCMGVRHQTVEVIHHTMPGKIAARDSPDPTSRCGTGVLTRRSPHLRAPPTRRDANVRRLRSGVPTTLFSD